MRSRLALTSDDVVVASTTITFDIAALELFAPLMTGASVAIAPEGLAGRPVEFGEWIAAVGGTSFRRRHRSGRLSSNRDGQDVTSQRFAAANL